MYYTYHTISLGWVMLGIFITLLFIALLLGALVVLSNKKLTVISILIATVLSAFLLFENIRMCNAFSSLKDLNNVLNDIALNNTQLSSSESSEELCSFVENVINGEVKTPRGLYLYREEVISYIWFRIIWAIVAYLIGTFVIFITMENYYKRTPSSRARRVHSHDDF